ncbi:hypothetical protein [Desulfoscipio gibsoniae]
MIDIKAMPGRQRQNVTRIFGCNKQRARRRMYLLSDNGLCNAIAHAMPVPLKHPVTDIHAAYADCFACARNDSRKHSGRREPAGFFRIVQGNIA